MDAGSAALLVLRTGLQGHGSQQKLLPQSKSS